MALQVAPSGLQAIRCAGDNIIIGISAFKRIRCTLPHQADEPLIPKSGHKEIAVSYGQRRLNGYHLSADRRFIQLARSTFGLVFGFPFLNLFPFGSICGMRGCMDDPKRRVAFFL